MSKPKHAVGETVRFRFAPWMFPNSATLTGEITEAKYDSLRDKDYYHISVQIKGETVKGIIWANEIIECGDSHA